MDDLEERIAAIGERCGKVKDWAENEPTAKEARRTLKSARHHAAALRHKLDDMNGLVSVELGMSNMPRLKRDLEAFTAAIDNLGDLDSYRSHRPNIGADNVTYEALIVLLRELWEELGNDPADASEFILNTATSLGYDTRRIKERL